jgi:hypothetical protein
MIAWWQDVKVAPDEMCIPEWMLLKSRLTKWQRIKNGKIQTNF